MIGEVVPEEVPALLTVNREHRHHVSRVHSVPEELQSNDGRGFELLGIRLRCEGHSDDDVLAASEDPSIVVTPQRPPLGCGHHSH